MNRMLTGACLALCCGLAGTSLAQQGRVATGGNTLRIIESTQRSSASRAVRRASLREQWRVAQQDEAAAPEPTPVPEDDMPAVPQANETPFQAEEPVAPSNRHPLAPAVQFRDQGPLDAAPYDEQDEGPSPFATAPYYGNTSAPIHHHVHYSPATCGCERASCGCEPASCGCEPASCGCEPASCGCEPSCGVEAHGCSGCAPQGCKSCRRCGLLPDLGRGLVRVGRGLDCVGQTLDCVGQGVSASARGVERLLFRPLNCRSKCRCGGAGCASCSDCATCGH